MTSVLKLTLLAATLSLLSGCAASNVLLAPADGCSTLVPDAWKKAVPHAEIGAEPDPALKWQLYGVAETGQLNVANTQIVGGWGIVEMCEARDRRAAERVNAPAWQFWR